MKYSRITGLVAAVGLLAMLGVSAQAVADGEEGDSNKGGRNSRAVLTGYEEVPAAATGASGRFRARIAETVSLETCVMPFAGLTAWLPGDGSAVETVTDAAAIWTGVETYAAGRVAQGFSVGSGNYVSLPFEQAGPFTVQAWVNAPDRLLPEFTGVLSTGGSAQSTTSLQIELDGTGNYRLNVGDGALSMPIGPALDFFQHVALTFDGSTLTAYLDGQLVQSDVWAGSPGLGFHVLNVGIDRESLHPFTGLIDEVQVFNRALSDEEVAQTFLTGASGLCKNGPPLGVSPLGSAQSFAVLGASIVTNVGPTVLTGSLGVSPAIAITGFPPGVVSGTIHAGDLIAAQAQADAGIAYAQFRGLPCLPANNLTGQVLGATVLSLPPGVYCFDTSAQLTGTLSLTGAGPWIFQIGSTLTTAGNAAVVVADAGSTCSGANVFWQVGSSATLGAGTQFAGTILALASVTVMTGANVSGSVLALNAAVTLDNNAVSVCAPPPANQPPVADAGPDQVVPFASLATLDGSGSSDDGLLQPLSYSWVSDTGFSAAGQVATVSLPLGTHVFTLTVNDGDLSASDSVTITVMDVTAPVIVIASPVADAAYALDQIVFASYTCTDESGIASCTGTVASGAPIDTSSPGSKPFCVTAVDGAGNTSTQCVSYSVLEPPTITVTSPIEPIYELGSLLFAGYSCGDAATCTGDVASGSALDTSTPGLKSFTITATDAAGNTTTQLVTYTVSLGTCAMPSAGLTAWLPGDGSAVEIVTDAAAIWTGVETYAAGRVAQGFSVGNGNYVSLPFQQVGAFTLQAWVRAPDRLLPEFTGVLSTGGSAQSATSLQIELDGTGNYRLNVGDGAVSWLIGPALDFFQHVALTFDGSTLTAYLNGQLVQSGVWAGSPELGFHVLNLGIDRDGLRPFTGLVDEVQVFNRALSAADVEQTFLTGASGLCNNRPAEGGSPLGSAQSFAVLGASIVTNTGPTVVTGDLGISPGIAITGFPPGVVVGTIHAGDLVAAQAQADARIAYTQLRALPCLPINNLTGQVLGSTVLSLPPGVYCFDTSAQVTGTLFLTGTGPWLFQIGSTLTTAGNAAVVVADAGSTCSGANVFWQVGSSATLGAGTQFAGTILALASVTVMTGASVSGSVLALNAAVTLDDNPVSVCAPPPANQPPVADAGPDQVVPFASLATLDGSASSDDGLLQPLSYSWVSDTGFSAAGQVATVSLPLGTHVFTLTVNDGELSASDSVTITVMDVSAPAIAIASPVADAAYAIDQMVLASYTCTDASGIASCIGTAASGAPIDTSSPGSKPFCVTAVDGAGNTSTQCVSYSVLEPPTITVTSPIEPIYELGSLLLAGYSCGDAATCTGGVASGSALDTSTPGLKSFTITATDAAGNTTTQLVTYTVSLGTCVMPFADLTAWLPGDGSAVETVTGAAAIWTGVATYAAGKVGQGFSVGNGNYASLPFEQAGPFTVQAWVRAPDRLLPEFTGVVSTGGSAQSATSLQIELDGTGNYRLSVGDSTLSWLLGPALDFFQHVSVTFDGSTIAVYLNGQLVRSDVWAGSPGLGFHVLNVGIDREGLRPFTGLIDEVQVFNRALSDADVGQTFLAGASGLCNNRPPVAVAVAAPNPAEATGPDGAMVSLDGTGSSDPDLDTLTCTWHEGATPLGTACLLSTSLTIGSHAITLTVDDGQGRTAASDVVVQVRDTIGPALTVPPVLLAEATSPLGASVSYTASATDVVSGAVPMTCAPASGGGFAIGATVVNCSATDTAGNIASATFNVIVSDTIAPEVQITTSADALLSGSTFAVVVQANDTVGIAAVTVNGIEATRQSPLGSAQSFAVLGASIITNTGATLVTGDLGVSPGAAITGFPPGIVVGTIHAGDMVAAQAHADAGIAYGHFKGLPCLPANNLTGQVLGTTVLSLPPGVYCFDTSAQLTGTLSLTGAGPWIFQIGSTLTTASDAAVVVVDAGTTCSGANVFWQVGSSATLGTDTQFAGTILALASTTLMTGVSVSGSVQALTAAVTLGTNNVSVCEAPPPIPANTGFSADGKVATVLLPFGTHVNASAAFETLGTAQAGTWLATVPVELPVAPGGVLRFEVRGSDMAGNAGTGTLLVDNDGIPAAMDRSRAGGIDESVSYSNDFAHGPTAGTLTRNGWTMKLSNAPTPSGVRATVSGSGSIARISACTGAAKEVRLNVIGETADITCASTGTITVKAISAVMQIELREQLATGAWQQFNLRTGQSMSVGSPATASIENVEPIDVQLVQIDGAGRDTVVGSYQLRPGASVDVSALPGAPGRYGQVRFKVLSGSVSVTVSGRMRTLTAGQGTTMQIERLSPIRP